MIASVSHSRMRVWQVLAGSLMLAVLPSSLAAEISGSKVEVTPDAYRVAKNRGVVVMSVGWGRLWGFCGSDNVQLRTFAFDRVPVQKHGDDEPADLVLKPPPSLLAGPGTAGHYALLMEPGEYALTYSEIKVARSVNDVATYSAGRKTLIADGHSLAGSFTVGAGELVYVGHFSLDCIDGKPRIWRYYITDRKGFQQYKAIVKSKYPFLDTEKIQYRLFKTSLIGHNFELP
jgi:hypothetical protein